MSKWVYDFGFGNADGNASMRDILGGKGANLAEMNKLGISVPPGFTISTKVCDYYYAHKKTFPNELKDQVDNSIKNFRFNVSIALFYEIYKFLNKQKISKKVINVNQSTNILHKLFNSKKSQKNIKDKINKIGQKILEKNINEINLILNKI